MCFFFTSFTVWSFGVVIYEMMHGEPPKRSMKSAAIGVPIKFNPDKQNSFPFLFSMAQKCLQKDPSCRPTAAQLLQEFKNKAKLNFLLSFIVTSIIERVLEISHSNCSLTLFNLDLSFFGVMKFFVMLTSFGTGHNWVLLRVNLQHHMFQSLRKKLFCILNKRRHESDSFSMIPRCRLS